jgi:hypothetical protein
MSYSSQKYISVVALWQDNLRSTIVPALPFGNEIEGVGMIIWGFRIVYSFLSQGVFFCPEEGADRPYALKSRRRFFTIFFIPLIPLKQLENVVECGNCKTKFQETVLNRPTGLQRAESFVEAVRGATVAVLRAGTVTEMSRTQAVRLVSNYIPGYNEQMLVGDMGQYDVTSLQAHLRSAAVGLDDHGKEGLLTHLTLVAAADKQGVSEAERNVLEHCGNDLGMTATHAKGTMDSVIQQLT